MRPLPYAKVDESCMIPIESNGSEQDLEIL
jgi:hypothetical protein